VYGVYYVVKYSLFAIVSKEHLPRRMAKNVRKSKIQYYLVLVRMNIDLQITINIIFKKEKVNNERG